MCACGQPLHYSDPQLQAHVERLVRELGAYLAVQIGKRVWLVPRHYIALHGLAARDVPTLGFEEYASEIEYED